MKNLTSALLLTIFSFLLVFQSKADFKRDSIPSFTFYTLKGTPFQRKDMQLGKKSLFILYDGSCEHCQYQISNIDKHYEDFKNTQFYLVTENNEKEINQFMSIYGKNLKDKPNLVLLQDPNKEFIPKFDPNLYPGIVLFSERDSLLFKNTMKSTLKDLLFFFNSRQ